MPDFIPQGRLQPDTLYSARYVGRDGTVGERKPVETSFDAREVYLMGDTVAIDVRDFTDFLPLNLEELDDA